MKIYTKTGDKGTTGLIGGTRVPKDHLRIEAYGTVDELNSHTGMLRTLMSDAQSLQSLYIIQHKLFTIGSNLALEKESKLAIPSLNESDVTFLEKEIDRMNDSLQPLSNFILPGGSSAASAAHICRTVCRRAERAVVRLNHEEETDQLIVQYLNRLSDYYFTLARFAGHLDGTGDVLWDKSL